MEESIDRIVSEEAFSQLKQLLDSISTVDDKMQGLIKTVDGLRKSLDSSSGLKQVADEYEKIAAATEELNKASKEKIAMDEKVAKESKNLADYIAREREEYRRSSASMDEKQKKIQSMAEALIEQQRNLQGVTQRLKDMKTAYKESGSSSEELKQVIAGLVVDEAKLKDSVSESVKQLRSRIVENNNDAESMKSKKALLASLKQQWDTMSDSERKNSSIGSELRNQMYALNESIRVSNAEAKGMSRTFGETTISVNNVKLELRSMMQSIQQDTMVLYELRTAIEEQNKKVKEAAAAHGESSKEYQEEVAKLEELKKAHEESSQKIEEMRMKAGQLKDVINDTSDAIQAWSSDTPEIDAMVTGLDTLSRGYTVVKGTMTLFGIESKNVMEVMAKVQLIQQSVIAVQKIANNLTKESVFKAKLMATWNKMRAAYLEQQTKAMVKNNASEKVSTAETAKNTVAEAANTQQKVKNTAATSGATAATGALAAGETAATATSFTLVGALKAVAVAIKSIPIIGWILAVISALIAVTKMIVNLVDLSDSDAEKKARLIELESEHMQQVSQILIDSEKYNKELEKSLEIIKKRNTGISEYKESLKNVSDALGLSEEYLLEHADDIDILVKKAEEFNKEQALRDNAEKEYLDLRKKQESIDIKLANIRKMDYDSRKAALDKMVEEGELTEEQAKNLNNLMHQSLEYGYKEGYYQKIIGEELEKNVDTSKEYLETKKKSLDVANDSYEAAKKELNAQKDLVLIAAAKEQMNKRVDDAEIARLSAEARSSKDYRKQKEAEIKAEEKAFKQSCNEKKKAFEELVAGLNKESEEYHELEAQRNKEADDLNKEHLAKLKLIEQNYAKEARQRAKERADAESDIKIAEYDYMLSVVTNMEDKHRYYSLKMEEELTKKKRAINNNETLTKKQKIAMIQQAERDSAKKIADNYKQMVDKQIDYAIKLAKDLSSAVSNVDTQKLKEIQQSMKYESDPEELKRKKQSEIDLMVDMEEKKHQQILEQNWEARDKEMADFQGGEEEWMKLVEKWNAIETAEELRHSNELVAIYHKNIENKRKALDDAIKKLEDDFKDRENRLIVEQGGSLSEGQKLKEQMNLVQQQIDKWNELKEAYIEAGMSEEEWQRNHVEMLAKQVVLEEEYAQRRKDALVELGGAMLGLGNALADMVDDEVKQTKIKQALAVAEVLMNQGIAISEAVKEGIKGDSYTAAMRIMAAMATITTAIMSAINAVKQSEQSIQQAETYAEGTDYHHGGAAIIGEAGYPELVMSKGKSFVVDAPTFFPNLPVGSKVIPLVNDNVTDLSAVIEGIDRLNRKDTVQVNVGKDVYTYIWNGAGRTRILNKKFMH